MENEKNEISFKPLTSGLGFHPFSDGLPYAPLSQTPSTGTGATAAGRPVFVKQFAAPVARISVPVTPQTTLVPAPTTSAELTAQIENAGMGFFYLFKRFLAFGVDSILNFTLCATALSFALLRESLQPDLLLNPGVVLISGFFFVIFNWAIVTAQEVAFGTSIGKRIFGLALEGSTSAVFLRALFFLPSFGFFCVGLIWSVFDSDRRCWHDMIVNVQPIEIARL